MTGLLSVVCTTALVVIAVPTSAATTDVLLAEVLGSWQGDDTVQFVELAITADGATDVSGGTLTFATTTGERRSFQLARDVSNGTAGARILVATERAADVTGVTPDFVLPEGLLAPRSGRLCYQVTDASGDQRAVDCLAYGGLTGDNGAFGNATALTPDDRSLERIDTTGNNEGDWRGRLRPTPQNNAGSAVTLATLCGDDHVDEGEECDGTMLGGATCESLGFAKGDLACTQCHLDTSACNGCGNGVIDDGEDCDTGDLGGRSCTTLGFTGGTLGCTTRCKLDTASCDPTFYVAGGGARAPDCLAEWRITNSAGRLGKNGKTPLLQRCKDGDSGCDADSASGTCTFTIAICFDHDDPRLAHGDTGCARASIATWELIAPRPASNGGADAANALLTAVSAVGPSSVAGSSVTFTPPLDPVERCTSTIAVGVPRNRTMTIRARTTGEAVKPRDLDRLKLRCVP
jgi:hypothetical protein